MITLDYERPTPHRHDDACYNRNDVLACGFVTTARTPIARPDDDEVPVFLTPRQIDTICAALVDIAQDPTFLTDRGISPDTFAATSARIQAARARP